MSSTVDLAYEHATANVASQRARVDNLRTRAAALITAASLVASFLGGQALADTRIPEGGASPVADRTLQLAELVAIMGFLGVFALAAWTISPRANWKFQLDGSVLLADWRDDGDQDMKAFLVGVLQKNYALNEKKLAPLTTLLQIAIALLAVEAIAFMLDLTI